ncbi:MAG TPA: Amuc_1100 family pilus-like protein, partial [Candidatus Acidoferrales bacterium]|nr:Amuc_1100 family pilus-like protein [Candidatus Acidoferrales bacterium]
MGWIKRNLLFVVIGLVALAALGGAGFFIYQSFSNNSEKAQKLNELYDALGNLNKEQPQPGATNTAVAKEQEQQLRVWISQAASHFRPIPPIPAGEVTSMTFGTALNNVINELTQEAKENSVTLPPKYCFSFQVQNGLLTISSGLGPLAQQLGEVKTIAQIMFAAGVNNLDSIQRVKVSEDDVTKGLESDYTDKLPITNHLAILTPYIVTFRCF